MKFTCESARLAQAMATVSRALSGKSVMPVLEGVLVRAADNGVAFSCTDLKMGIQCVIPAQVDQGGEAVLQGRLFYELTRRLPEGNVEINVVESGENAGAVITAPGLRTRLFIMDAADFPPLPEVADAKRLMLPGKTLRNFIRQTAFAAALDESRPILTGVLLEVGQGKVRTVALDGYRLALAEDVYEGEVDDIRVVIPAGTLNRLSNIIDDAQSVTIELGQSHLGVEVGDTRLVSRLLEGEYLKYAQIIPGEHTTRAVVDQAAMAHALDRAAMLAREGRNNLVKLQLGEGGMVMTSNSDSGDIYEEIPAELEGKELEIAFNARYLVDIFKNIDAPRAVLTFTSNVSPCVIRPEGGENLYLVLPVRVYGS